ncbi:MAG: serine/threonine protein kinase, partial [Phycisphaerae bacterium]
PDAPPALTAAARHAALLDSLGRAAEADAIYAAALERSIAADGTKPASLTTRAIAATYGRFLDRQGRSADAANVRGRLALKAPVVGPPK